MLPILYTVPVRQNGQKTSFTARFGIESIGVTSNGDMTDIPCGRDTSRTLVLLFLARGPIVFHLSFTSC